MATFDACFADLARRAPDAIALEDHDGAATFAEVDARVAQAAANIAARDLGTGAKVVLIAENSVAHLVTAFAIWRAGATLVTVYPSSTASEIEHALTHSRPVLVIAGESVLATVEPVARTLGLELLTLAEARSAAGLTEGSGNSSSIDPDALALICYTSGSTALPKAVMHSHRGLFAAARAYAEVWHLGPADVNLVSMPLAWAFGLVTTSMATLSSGGRVVLFARSEPRALLTGFVAHRVTFFAGVTTMYVRMVEAMDRDPNLSRPHTLRLCISGGEPRNEVAFERWHELTGCPVHDVYAASECFPVVTSDPTVDPLPRPGYAGRVVPAARLRIAENGEAWARGPATMLGYWDDPALTQSVLTDDGWYRTGDLVEIDDEGYVRVLGRISDVIIRAGANVSPAEVESVLVSHPLVAEAGVVGLPDAVAGEEVVAAVVGRPGVDLDLGALAAHCAVRLASFKRPRLVVVEQLPRSASTGKVNRRALKAQLIAEDHR